MTAWRGLGEAVTAHPDGKSTAARMALTAADSGYDAIILRNAGSLPVEPTIRAMRETFGIDVVHGTEVRAGRVDAVSGRLPHLRNQTTVLMVGGGTERLNRFVTSQDHVDVLTAPVTPDGPDIDPGIATAAAEHDVAIELDLGPLRGNGGTRVRYIDRLRRLWRVIEHESLPYVCSVSPASHLGVVAPRELAALANLVGIDTESARAGLAGWSEIAERNRDRFGEGFIDADG